MAGLALLWWAGQQLNDIVFIFRWSFQWSTWRLLGWVVTVMAVGAVFGFAAHAAGSGVARAHGLATVVVMALPLAFVVYWWGYLSFGWLPGLGARWFVWSFPTAVAVASAIVGFLLAGLLASRVRWSR
jgi:hypothetical protein